MMHQLSEQPAATAMEQSHSDRLRELLLPSTVAHAVARSPYYRARVGNLAGEVQTLRDLPKLPLLEKADLVRHVDQLRTFERYPDFLMYTSGTTGEPLEVPVYREEIAAYDELVLRELARKIPGAPPLSLTVLRVGHGSHVVTPAVPTIPCHINYGTEQIVRFLRSKHWLNGQRVPVSNLELNVLNLRQLTGELLEQGIDPSSFGLSTVSVSGWYIPHYERKRLEELWGAILLDRYGVTEVNGDAKWCHLCEAYHFDFTVIPEFLDPDTEEPIEYGVGQMVLTGLYPFNQAIPKLRYRVRDLVWVERPRCRSPEKAVRFMSRLQDAVRLPGGTGDQRYRLYSSDVAEVLAPLPDVARKSKTGFMKFRLTATPEGEARLDIELTYHPRLYERRAGELQESVLHQLARRRPNLGRPALQLHPPGGLQSITKV